jgi:hypothetical protein
MENLTSGDFEIRTRKPKILTFDIESTPMLIWAYDTFNANALKIEQDWFMLCWSAKWLGGKQISKGIWDYKGYKRGSTDDKELVTDLWKLLDEADVIIGHNARKFDVRKTQAKVIEYGLGPWQPFKVVDTWLESKKLASFSSHRLGALGEKLNIGEKLPTDKQLWFDTIKGDEKAQARMLRYCKQDTRLTEELYLTLRPYMSSHPNMAVLRDKRSGCRNCGSTDMQARGYALTLTGRRRRFQCKSCGAYMQGKHQQMVEVR